MTENDNKDQIFAEAYKDWLKKSDMDSWNEDKARAYFDEHGNLDDLKVEIVEEKTSQINHQEEGTDKNNENASSSESQRIEESWKKYCQEHNLLEPTFTEGPAFALYKDSDAKSRNDYIAKMKYGENHNLSITTQKGMLPDFSFFQQTAKVEKEGGSKRLSVDSENPDFKALMLAAALEAGLDIGKEQIDLNLDSVKNLPKELQDKIAAHNNALADNKENQAQAPAASQEEKKEGQEEKKEGQEEKKEEQEEKKEGQEEKKEEQEEKKEGQEEKKEEQEEKKEENAIDPHAKTKELREKLEAMKRLKKEKRYNEADTLLTPEQAAERKRRGILRSKNPKVTEEIRNQNRVTGLEKRQKTASEEQKKIINDLLIKYRGNSK